MKLQLAHRKDKLRIYKTLIQTVLGYGSEAWTMGQSSEERVTIFKRKLLKRTFGPAYENYLWWKPM
jgi:hypothetical protein